MKDRSLSKLFLGLLLLFFNINIYQLNLITVFIGALLIVTVTWKLKLVDRHFVYAFRCGVVLLAFHTLNFVLLCAQMSGNMQTTLLISVASGLNMMVLMYNLFSGLSEMALALEDDVLGKKLRTCYTAYIIATVLVALAMFVPTLIILALPVFVIVAVYILVQVYRLEKLTDRADKTFEERRLGGRFYAVLGAYVGLTVILCFSVLIVKNCPAVKSEIYVKNDLPEQADIQNVKDTMVALGFDLDIVNDLPDSEVVNYQNVLSVEKRHQVQQLDGGSLELIHYAGTFEGGRIRYLFFYRWLTNPKHQFADSLSVELPMNLLVLPNDWDYAGSALYDKRTGADLTTYKATFLKDGSPNTRGGPPNADIVYRVFGRGAINQRGFFAYNVLVSRSGIDMMYNIVITYLHQKSVFNIDNETDDSFSQQQITYDEPNRVVYDKFLFVSANEYKPVT